jgi:cytochrome c biogenesis protein CcmG, thiol:disulfide interchange protein DsbE
MSLLRRTSVATAFIIGSAFSTLAQNAATNSIVLDELDGSTSTLSEYLQKGPVYISFWALWCVPCLQELRALEGVAERNKEDAFTILAVNQDTPKSLAKVKAYVSSQGYAFPVIVDPNAQILQAFNGLALPFSVLLGKNGRVIHTRTGYLPGDEKEIEREILEAANSAKATE